ncbi:MAG: TIGR01459 family HAD-type hydrolase [Alphaproteobacteria bacterium]|nr:TIGR01459 family HAD-type hydrolase [Alphaproteobacteria bacterium]
MKMIKPIVNLSKTADNYDTFILGLNGVLHEGKEILPAAADALRNLIAENKKIILLTNSYMRIATIADWLRKNGVNPQNFHCIMSAGEILHYKLKSAQGAYAALGDTYYHLGDRTDKGVFSGLNYTTVNSISSAHFLYMNDVIDTNDTIDIYRPYLEQASALGLPLVCAGNDTSCFKEGKICLSCGAIAEQYAIMGGRIITLGKPDTSLLKYCIDGIDNVGNILVIGDNVATDIKAATLLGWDSMLISKGIHVNYLGEGYIPDVAKTRELSNGYDASPDYVISNLRW